VAELELVRPTMRVALTLLCALAVTAQAGVIATSPDGAFEVRLITLGYDPLRGTRQRVEIVDRTSRKVLYSWKSVHRASVKRRRGLSYRQRAHYQLRRLSVSFPHGCTSS